MKIVLFGATGHIGQRIATEAVQRGHAVVGIARNPSTASPAGSIQSFVAADATDAQRVTEVVRGTDAVVCAISPRPGSTGHAPSLTDVARALIAGLTRAGVKRLVIVGGAGSLEVAPGLMLLDAPGFPEEYNAEAVQARNALALYRAEAGQLDWTFVSPAALIAPGARTGRYRTTGDQLLTDAQGKSAISSEDYAVAILDELERPQHVRQRFGVAY